ncbi:MAG: glycine cleavage system protein GcvH [Nitrospirae bacterium]|nr:glycine cleavage system protein GcvH [Nitrospirota bacterium]MBI3352319.1 glycine cleavage system protein GcvH [Nitrospirota bacterium]
MRPEDLKFSTDHEWVKKEGKRATIGITDFAQESLGDIVFIETPETNIELSAEEEIMEIESTKTTSPVLAPISGKIIEVNQELKERPELINEDPYGLGWIAVIEMSDPSELDNLMDYKEYEEFIREEQQEED